MATYLDDEVNEPVHIHSLEPGVTDDVVCCAHRGAKPLRYLDL